MCPHSNTPYVRTPIYTRANARTHACVPRRGPAHVLAHACTRIDAYSRLFARAATSTRAKGRDQRSASTHSCTHTHCPGSMHSVFQHESTLFMYASKNKKSDLKLCVNSGMRRQCIRDCDCRCIS
eukprot:6190328-Pleurochrysis_carterae.AAC.2